MADELLDPEDADAPQRAVHEAITGLLEDGEIAVCWTLTIDVAGTNDTRYLAHRSGGGIDGTDGPMAWTALGMLQSSVNVAADCMAMDMVDPGDDE